MFKYRRLPLEKLVNARDLGGYAAAGGKITKYGVFLRTDCPVEISEKDWQYLKDYGVTMSIDLRGNDEAADSPSALADVPGHTYVHLSITGEHLTSWVKLRADVLHKLRDDCAAVLDTDREKGRDAAIELMRELFPLTGDLHEMFSPHGYDQMYFDQLEQTRIFLDHLFTLDGAEDAMYAYDPYF